MISEGYGFDGTCGATVRIVRGDRLNDGILGVGSGLA